MGMIRKLFMILIGVMLFNLFMYDLGPRMEENISFESDFWQIPLICTVLGFVLGLPVSLFPYKGLEYKKKYILSSLILSIVFNSLLILAGLILVIE